MNILWPDWATPSIIAKTLVIITLLGYIIHAPLEFIHHLVEILHIVYESIAYVLEEILHHVFHLNKFQSQLIVFYGSLTLGLFALYRLYQRLPAFLQRQQVRFYVQYLRLKIFCLGFWRQASWVERAKLMLIQMGFMMGAFMYFLG